MLLTVNGVDAGCLETVEPDVSGCTDENASNYNADANVDDGSCEFPDPVVGIVFSGTFGGTVANANTVLYAYRF